MDVASYLRCFEDSLASYSGDDPLDPWDKFVDFLEQRQPAGGSSEMSLVFNALVQRFLNVDRYANDLRYVNYCIRCASYYPNPIALYAHVFSQGIGTRTAALYVAWAQHFEQKGMKEQADAVYQKALENQAQPADTVLHEYRQFQSRTRTQPPASGARVPLQNFHLTNQCPPIGLTQNKVSADSPSKPPLNRTITTVSRSETSGTFPSNHNPPVQSVPEYIKDNLVCEGSEFCFEEVRAEKYFRKIREKQEQEQREIMEKKLREQEEEVQRLKSMLEQVNQGLEACGGFPSRTFSQQVDSDPVNQNHVFPPQPSAAPSRSSSDPFQSFSRSRPSNHPSSRRSLGLRLHSDWSLIQEAGAGSTLTSEVSHPPPVLSDWSAGATTSDPDPPGSSALMNPSPIGPADVRQPGELSATPLHCGLEPEPEEKLDASQGGAANLSHVTPNTSLGVVQATPSRVLPSPTVNTREALGVIMDMFRAPTFLDEGFQGTSVLPQPAEEPNATGTCAEPGALRLQGGSGSPGSDPLSPSLVTVMSSLPKSPTSAPFTIFQDDEDKENGGDAAPSRKSKPVRALAEVSGPKADKPNETPSELIPDESTMWGARYNSLNSLAACPNSTTDFALLAQFVSTPFTHKTPFSSSFIPAEENNGDGGVADENVFIRRQTKKLSPIMEQSPCDDQASELAGAPLLPSSASRGTIMSDGFTCSSLSMVQPPPPAVLSFRDQTLCPSESAGPGWEVYASPERIPVTPRGEPFQILEDPEKPASPGPLQNPVCDVPMSPGCPPEASWLDIRSPEATAEPDLDAFLSPRPPSGPDAASTRTQDVPMSPAPVLFCSDALMMSPSAGAQLVSDPWDADLISGLLSRLRPPLTSHPRCITWPCRVPLIAPSMTLSMGTSSLRVDRVLGQGAFATVFQATDPVTSDKVVLKVQKPANPWEFHINACLDSRLPPAVRHLFINIRSAHLFQDGSIMLGELHNYGTLLNAVNVYRTLSDKVMPQPLVLYFAACILNMVEQLHAARVIHADIKPDNFMLGERFLENRCFDPEGLDHGLVLIDFGQSIDMTMFPECTAFTSRCLTSGFQCTEMLSGKPWSYQTDYFGVAGTVYCMLFGTYMQVTQEGGVWKTNGVFRRNPHSDLWLDFFHTLLNVPDCGSLPSLRSLRCRLASVLQQSYSSKLPTLKSRLVIQLLENHRAARR
ncbi:LOW QUALITY PROTEIN: mitotic checkpoint serine/threonine-protein kinase BUB1 [Anableps anableps]